MWERIRCRLNIPIITVSGCLLYFVVFTIISVDMQINMSRGALLIFIPGVLLATFDLVRTCLGIRSAEKTVVPNEFFVFLAWCLAFFVAICIIGFQIAFILFIVLYLRFRARTRWLTIGGVFTVGLVALFYFGEILMILWPEGILKTVFDNWLPSNNITRFFGF